MTHSLMCGLLTVAGYAVLFAVDWRVFAGVSMINLARATQDVIKERRHGRSRT